MGGRRWGRVAAAATLMIGAVTALAGTATAGQEVAGLEAEVIVRGPAPDDVLALLTLEAFLDNSGTFEPVDPLNCSTIPQLGDGPFVAAEDSTCTLQPGDYAIGIDGVPDGWDVSAFCNNGSDDRIESSGALFTFYGFSSATCTVEVSTSILLVDKVVVGGDSASSDFTIEVLDDQGASVASGSDVADATCEADYDAAKCGAIAVPSGTGFQIAEPDVENYELTSIECAEFIDATTAPEVPEELVPVGEDGFRTDDGDTYCVVTNTYVPPPTTTTTTTTTTVAPTTTLVTTTSIDAGVVTLPQTGTSSSTNTAIAAVAALFVLLGGAMLAARRRVG